MLAITVTTPVDENDGPDVGGISLREAIAAAAPGEVIEFAPALTSGGPATILLTRGELQITKDLTINGPGAALLTIDASGNDSTPNSNEGNGSRVFQVNDTTNALKNVTLRGLRMTGGDASLAGGGILARENLTLVDCIVTGNATRTSSQQGGGGISSNSAASLPNALTLIRCTISNNQATLDEGGGIRKQHGTLVMEDCTVTGNTAANHGGGLSAADGGVQITIRRSSFASNRATTYYGGGIFLFSANMELIDSTLSGNTATYGGGLYITTTSQVSISSSLFSNNNSSNDGGAIDSVSSQLTITGTTISGNSALGYGGGVDAFSGGSVTIKHSTIVLNRANTNTTGNESGGGIFVSNDVATSLDHVIVAKNTRLALTPSDAVGSMAVRFSLIGDSFGLTLTSNVGNLLGPSAAPFDPMLGPLADNGGPTRTHALLAGSMAIDAGDPAATPNAGAVPAFDQRGAAYTRVYNGDGPIAARIDMGAIELQPNVLAGDFNNDAVVDGADFLSWQMGLGVTGAPAAKAAGNADGDGDVDGVDLAIWRTAFGAVQQAGDLQATVPAQTVFSTSQARSVSSRIARGAATTEMLDAAMAWEQLLGKAAPRPRFRPRPLA